MGPPSSPTLLQFLYFLLFLWGAPLPALGNEGGSAGSCKCSKTNLPPKNVQSTADRLESWDHCRDLVRFTFPKKTICGLAGEPWVEELKSLTPSKRKGAASAEASKGGPGPTPISPPAQITMGPPARTATDEPLRGQPDPHLTTVSSWAPGPSQDKPGGERKTEDPPRTPPTKPQEETPKICLASDVPFFPGTTLDTPGLARSPTTAGQGAAGVGPSHFAPQASQTQHTKIAVPVLLVTTFLLVAIILFLVCRKKRQPCRKAPATPLPPQDPREETLALRRLEET